MFKKFLILSLSGVSFITNGALDYNKNFPKSLLSLNSEFTLIQLENDKLYLVNEKFNHKGCQKILNSPAFEWNVKARNYIKPVSGADEGISENNIKKLNYVLLTNTPMNKKIKVKEQIEEKTKDGEMYCEVLRATFK